VAKYRVIRKVKEPVPSTVPLLDPKGCGHKLKDHAKRGPKPPHPSFRTLAKQGIDMSNSEFYPTSELAFCNNPLCCCIDFIGTGDICGQQI